MVLIKIHEELPSTNVYALEQLRASDVEEFTVFRAINQTLGKGQKGNFWESERGKNLTFSVVLRPVFLPISRQYMLSKVVCLSLFEVLSRRVSGVKIKWPNDIYVGEKKICGVLIENQIRGTCLSGSVVGIGMNVNQELFFSDAPNPVSLYQLLLRESNLDELLLEVLNCLERYYEVLRVGERVEDIDVDFLERLFQLGEWCDYRDEGGLFVGKIVGVNEIGQLVIKEQQSGELRVYHFKEVSYILN
ncbi:MAG: biotin--[acetyl-CoA-carboxylase] ligase [Mangrovibacterium sp.]